MEATPMSTQTVLTINDLALRWNVDRKSIYAMIERGELHAMRIGRLIRIPLAVVQRLEQAGAVQEG
jgi:excisionase family DNA binding protein